VKEENWQNAFIGGHRAWNSRAGYSPFRAPDSPFHKSLERMFNTIQKLAIRVRVVLCRRQRSVLVLQTAGMSVILELLRTEGFAVKSDVGKMKDAGSFDTPCVFARTN